MQKTGIIWDLDGTLLDTLEDLTDAVNYALACFGCPGRSIEEVRSFVGNGAGLLIRRALPGQEGDPDWQEVFACFKSYYDAHCRVKTAPYRGIMPLLAKLKQMGYPMAVVSNKPDSAVKILCQEHFGVELFAVTTGEIDGCPRKPAPDMVYRALDAMGLPAERCIYVGDSEVDVQTAQNVPMRCISVLWGFRDEDFLRQNGGAFFCKKPEEFLDMLREMEA